MPHLYILECSDGTYYVGSTWNLERRVSEHNLGLGAAYTRDGAQSDCSGQRRSTGSRMP
jgi:predicted GIY-YIG superfamily endonuclease